MSDLISRQAAISIVEFECGEWKGLAQTIVNGIKKLPSAQPKNNCSEIPNNSDLIDRQAAIDYCYQLINVEHQQGSDEMNYGQERVNQTETILHHLELMPSAKPERKTDDDAISKQAALDILDEFADKCIEVVGGSYERARKEMCDLPAAQPEIKTDGDMISRQQTIDALMQEFKRIPTNSIRAKLVVENLPSAQPETNCSETPNTSDTISRQDAVSRRRLLSDLKELITAWEKYPVMAEQIKGVEVAIGYVELIPSAQPERTCVNCGRTANNGGWYADGGTRCPIEEHYALPKDGFCHLWEKRNVTDDDYPERRTDGKST